MSEAQAMALAADPDVAFVQEDGEVRAFGSQQSPPWGLDRIDQLTGLDQTYRFTAVGQGVHVYVIDTGIRVTHQDFEGRASEEFSSIDDGWGASDCNGHGTHVAGTIGGAVSGVAKGVRLHGVRVLDCYGRGSDSQVLAGIDWVTEHHQKPAVANMSLGGDVSPALDIAVARSVAAGVTHVVAAGNDSADACGYSPARESSAITVGATAPPTDFGDELAWFSNHGRCVDLLAPGQYIASADARNDTDFIEHSGTSMASPHVAGAAALYLGLLPTANPGDVAQALVGAASPVAMPLPIFTPPLLLYTGFLPPEAGAPPTVVLRAPAPGAVLAGDVMLAAEAGVGSTLARVEFRVDGSSAGVDRLSPFELRWDSTLVPNGRHRIEAVGFDALWRPSNAAFADVQVMNVGRADRDPVFATPSCRSVGSRCFAGALIAGRGLTEPGSPNTIGGRCGDGISGKWLLGSSIEGIDVSTEGGGPLAPGERAIVRAKWLANSSADAIDFFTADDAERPEWTLRGTANAPGAGAATTSFNHILPAGDWQAVRLVYRSEYRTDPTALTHAPCSLDLYDDRDDLVFAVGDGVPDAVPPVVIVTGPSEAIAAAAAFLQAEATDDRVVRRVAFEVDDKLVGDDLAPPWEVAWLPPKAGDFSIVARAWDAAGNEGVGAPFVVHVRDLSPPSVKLNAPAAWREWSSW
jgi:subtilisin family serine protease